MHTIHADCTVSISAFKQNPNKVLEDAHGRPVAVLKNNRPGFYAVPSELYEQIADIVDDMLIAKTVHDRVERGDFVEVSLEDL